MIHRHRLIRRLPWFVLVAVAGCAARGPSALNYSVRQVADADRDALLDAAESSLVNLGYSIARRDAKAGLLTTHPREDDNPIGDSRIGQALRSSRRKVAEVHVLPKADAWSVYCKVAIQAQATESLRVVAAERASDDLPSETAIDRGAYSTPEQNTVWRTVQRDGVEERTLLAEILERSGQGTPRIDRNEVR